MIIIFEGPDGAGKSTAIQHLIEEHLAEGNLPETVQVWRAGPFPEGSNPWSEYVLPLSVLYPSKDWLVLIDRWHLGELVYGPLLRGGSRLSLEQRAWIEGYLKTMGAVMIHLTASVEELTRRLGERGDDLIKAEQLPYLVESYNALFAGGQQPRIMSRTYDTTGGTAGRITAGVYTLAKMDASIALSASRHPSSDQRPYWEKYPWPS
jgi:hypothetical protein